MRRWIKATFKSFAITLCRQFPIHKEEWESQFIYVEDSSLTDEQNEKARNKALKAHMDAYVGQGRRLFLRNLELMQLLRPAPLQKNTSKSSKAKSIRMTLPSYAAS